MTIFDATHKLFEYFTGNHVFSMKKNFKDIIPISEDRELEEATLDIALKECEENEMLKSTTIGEEKYYILKRAMETYDQSVTITYPTAYLVASALNEFCETIGDFTDAADVSSIAEKDIRNLVILNQHHKAELTRLMGEESGDNFNNKFGDGPNFENI